MLVRHDGAVAHHALEPVFTGWHGNIGEAQLLLQDQQHFRERLRQRPFDGAVDRAFRLGLVRVEGLDRIDDVVAHHASAVGGVLPVLRLQRADRAAIPFAGSLWSAAPILASIGAIAHVEDVVLEILEHFVGRFGALQIRIAMLEEGVAPFGGFLVLKMLERQHREAVVIAAAHRIQNQPVADRHRGHSHRM